MLAGNRVAVHVDDEVRHARRNLEAVGDVLGQIDDEARDRLLLFGRQFVNAADLNRIFGRAVGLGPGGDEREAVERHLARERERGAFLRPAREGIALTDGIGRSLDRRLVEGIDRSDLAAAVRVERHSVDVGGPDGVERVIGGVAVCREVVPRAERVARIDGGLLFGGDFIRRTRVDGLRIVRIGNRVERLFVLGEAEEVVAREVVEFADGAVGYDGCLFVSLDDGVFRARAAIEEDGEGAIAGRSAMSAVAAGDGTGSLEGKGGRVVDHHGRGAVGTRRRPDGAGDCVAVEVDDEVGDGIRDGEDVALDAEDVVGEDEEDGGAVVFLVVDPAAHIGGIVDDERVVDGAEGDRAVGAIGLSGAAEAGGAVGAEGVAALSAEGGGERADYGYDAGDVGAAVAGRAGAGGVAGRAAVDLGGVDVDVAARDDDCRSAVGAVGVRERRGAAVAAAHHDFAGDEHRAGR